MRRNEAICNREPGLGNRSEGSCSTNASIRSSINSSMHCRYETQGLYWAVTLIKLAARDWNGLGFRCKDETEDNHKWSSFIPGVHAGLLPHLKFPPYLKFAPKLSGFQADKTSFNQPDVWIALSKPIDRFRITGTTKIFIGLGCRRRWL